MALKESFLTGRLRPALEEDKLTLAAALHISPCPRGPAHGINLSFFVFCSVQCLLESQVSKDNRFIYKKQDTDRLWPYNILFWTVSLGHLRLHKSLPNDFRYIYQIHSSLTRVTDICMMLWVQRRNGDITQCVFNQILLVAKLPF